jgi:hypothetical protein
MGSSGCRLSSAGERSIPQRFKDASVLNRTRWAAAASTFPPSNVPLTLSTTAPPAFLITRENVSLPFPGSPWSVVTVSKVLPGLPFSLPMPEMRTVPTALGGWPCEEASHQPALGDVRCHARSFDSSSNGEARRGVQNLSAMPARPSVSSLLSDVALPQSVSAFHTTRVTSESRKLELTLPHPSARVLNNH